MSFAVAPVPALACQSAREEDVFERRTMAIAPGDKLLLRANRRDSSFRATNGEIVTVSEMDKKRRIHLKDGCIETRSG